jgi:hypothetical protein
MTVLFSISINANVSAQQGATQQGERSLIGYLTRRSLDLLEQGDSGNLIDQNGVVVGTFTYSPVASQWGKEKIMMPGDNDKGYHSRNRINVRESTNAGRPTSMSRNVGYGSEPGAGLPMPNQKVPAPHFERGQVGSADRGLTNRDNPELLKRGANRFPSGARWSSAIVNEPSFCFRIPCERRSQSIRTAKLAAACLMPSRASLHMWHQMLRRIVMDGASRAQQLGPAVQGRPGEKPEPCTVGISSAARDQLDRYSNDEIRRRVLAVVRKPKRV